MTVNLKVLDLSHHNTVTSFQAIRAQGIVGVILKCTQGANYADPTFADRVIAALAAGLRVGAYHFNSGENVVAQANNFTKHARPDDKMLMALDWEDNSASNMGITQCEDFLHTLDTSLGRLSKLYSGNRAKDLLGATMNEFLGSHPMWLAQYGPVPRVQVSWQTYWLWQYDDGTRRRSLAIPGVGKRDREEIDNADSVPHDGYDAAAPHGFDAPAGETDTQRLSLPGVGGEVDLNSYAGSDEQLAREWAS